MQAIKAFYDGSGFIPSEPIPVKGTYEVVITFTKPVDEIEARRQRLMSHAGTWDAETVWAIQQIVEERSNFSSSRPAHDFS